MGEVNQVNGVWAPWSHLSRHSPQNKIKLCCGSYVDSSKSLFGNFKGAKVPCQPALLGRMERHFPSLLTSEFLPVPSFHFLTGKRDHQETHLKIICGTQKEKRKSCWYISASLVKNISRHYKVHVINMHMWCLWGRVAFKVHIQQDNIFPCEARNNSESYVWEGRAFWLCTVFIPFCVLLHPLPSFINGFCNYC